MIDESEAPVETVARLIEALETSSVRYVHWKSNINIGATLTARTDLDILVHPDDRDVFIHVIEQTGFLQGLSDRDSWNVGMWHYFAPDALTRRMVHIHLHDRLTLGFDYDKNYTLPVVDWYLADARTVHGMRLPSIERELIILVIRVLVKHARLTRLARLPYGWRRLVRDVSPELSAGERTEMATLLALSSSARLTQVLADSGLGVPFEELDLVLRTLTSDPSSRTVQRLARAIKQRLRPFRLRGELSSLLIAGSRVSRVRLTSLASRLKIARRRRRRLGNGGRIVAFVGGDGSGKTTNVEALRQLIGASFQAERIHVGRPRRSARGAVVAGAARLLRILGTGGPASPLRHVALALDREAAVRRADRLRAWGGLAILDRIPLTQLLHMDAPRIGRSATGVAGYLGRIERRIYARLAKPDLLVVLKLDPAIALQRRPDDDREMLLRRSGEVWAAEWDRHFMFAIDTGERGVDAVMRVVAERVWTELTSRFVRTELIGLSGVGKSTVARGVRESLSNVRVSLPYKRRPFLLAWCAVAELFRVPPVNRLRLHLWKNLTQLRWFIYIHRELVSPFGSNAHHYLLDQGPVFQLAFGLKEGSLRPSSKMYARGLVAIDTWMSSGVIRLRAPKDVRYRRLHQRAPRAMRPGLLAPDRFEDFNASYRAAFRQLASDLPSMTRVSTARRPSRIVTNVILLLRSERRE